MSSVPFGSFRRRFPCCDGDRHATAVLVACGSEIGLCEEATNIVADALGGIEPRNDWRIKPVEDGILAAMRKAGLTPGNYMFPHPPSMQAMNEPGFVAKLEQGPVGIMTLRKPGKIVMGPYLTRQFLYHLVVSAVIAYLASRKGEP